MKQARLTRVWGVLAMWCALAACGSAAPEPAHTTTASAPLAGPPPETTASPAASGSPVDEVASMESAVAEATIAAVTCPSYVVLPTSFVRNTLVDARRRCVELPGLADIADGVHVIIVTEGELRLGAGARVDGVGSAGTQSGSDGYPEWRHTSHAEEFECICHATHCGSRAAGCNLPPEHRDLEATYGPAGAAGGSFHLIVRQAALGPGASIELTGGEPGPAGRPGRLRCQDGGNADRYCFSGPAGVRDYARGPSGVALFEVGTAGGTAMIEALRGITTPSESVSDRSRVIDTPRAFREAVDAAYELARAEGYDIVSLP